LDLDYSAKLQMQCLHLASQQLAGQGHLQSTIKGTVPVISTGKDKAACLTHKDTIKSFV